MKPDNQCSYMNIVVSIPADYNLRDKDDSKFYMQAIAL